MDEHEESAEHLSGGSGGVWRVRAADGSLRVHRPAGPWTPAVHALLRHLEREGLDGVPRVIGMDDAGREVLSYLPGRSAPEDAPVSRAVLRGAAAWLRRYHDAVASLDSGGLRWREPAPLRPGQLICHNDPGVYNWIIDDDEFAGVIDWDRAGPGFPMDDLAFVCWSGVPLRSAIPEADAAERVEIAADAYGGVDPAALLAAVRQRMRLTVERWRAGIDRGDPGTIALRDSGIMDRHLAALDDFETRERGISTRLAARPSAGKARHGLRE